MHTKTKYIGGVSAVATVALGVAIAFTALAHAQDKNHESRGETHDHDHTMKMTRMTQIKTQSEAEALKPGASIAMVCSRCKIVTVHPVGDDKSHAHMLAVGNTHTCPACDGKVTVEGTGRGNGKYQEVMHVCAECGEDSMFVVATAADGHDDYK